MEEHDAMPDADTDAGPPDGDFDAGAVAAPADTASGDAFAAMERADPDGAARLREEWGEDFENRLTLARRAAALVADDGLVAALEETGLGNDPRILRAAAKIGQMIAGGRGPEVAAGQSGGRAALERELDRLVAAPDYWSERVQRRVRQIHLSLHGGRSLPVHRAVGDAGGIR